MLSHHPLKPTATCTVVDATTPGFRKAFTGHTHTVIFSGRRQVEIALRAKPTLQELRQMAGEFGEAVDLPIDWDAPITEKEKRACRPPGLPPWAKEYLASRRRSIRDSSAEPL